MLHAKDLIPGRAARFLAAPLLLAPLALGSGVALGASSLSGGLLWAADMRPPSVVRVTDPARDVIVYEYRLNAATEGACSGKAKCLMTGVDHVRHGDRDYFDLALNITDPSGASPAAQRFSAIQRVRATPDAEVVFELIDLDFTQLTGGDAYCRQDPLDPCGAPQDPRCRLTFAEGFDIIHDDPEAETMTVVVADAENDRVLQATLNYGGGNTCAQVDWALGSPDPQWPGYGTKSSWPNSAHLIESEGAPPVLLLSFFFSGVGGSHLYAYRQTAQGWELAWTFPEAAGSETPFINTPHMAEVLIHPLTGQAEIWYSHSRGAAESWMADVPDYGATWASLAINGALDQPPTYRWELGIWDAAGAPQVLFTRDQDYLSDGTMLLTDAGCQNICPNEGVLYHVDVDFLPAEPSGLPGDFTSDHRRQAFHDIPGSALLSEYRCGYGALFEAGFVEDADLGSDLRAAARGRGRRCPK